MKKFIIFMIGTAIILNASCSKNESPSGPENPPTDTATITCTMTPTFTPQNTDTPTFTPTNTVINKINGEIVINSNGSQYYGIYVYTDNGTTPAPEATVYVENMTQASDTYVPHDSGSLYMIYGASNLNPDENYRLHVIDASRHYISEIIALNSDNMIISDYTHGPGVSCTADNYGDENIVEVRKLPANTLVYTDSGSGASIIPGTVFTSNGEGDYEIEYLIRNTSSNFIPPARTGSYFRARHFAERTINVLYPTLTSTLTYTSTYTPTVTPTFTFTEAMYTGTVTKTSSPTYTVTQTPSISPTSTPWMHYSMFYYNPDPTPPAPVFDKVYDTYITNLQPGVTFGTCSTAEINGYLGDDSRALIKFDIEGEIPEDAVIESAYLHLFIFSFFSTSGIDVRTVASEWAEGNQCGDFSTMGATYAERMFGVPWTTPGGDILLPIGNGPPIVSGGIYTIPLYDISVIQSWVDNPALNYGMILQNEDPSGEASFRTKETSNKAERPVLEIDYWGWD